MYCRHAKEKDNIITNFVAKWLPVQLVYVFEFECILSFIIGNN